jgi:hypothetical protein
MVPSLSLEPRGQGHRGTPAVVAGSGQGHRGALAVAGGGAGRDIVVPLLLLGGAGRDIGVPLLLLGQQRGHHHTTGGGVRGTESSQRRGTQADADRLSRLTAMMTLAVGNPGAVTTSTPAQPYFPVCRMPLFTQHHSKRRGCL